MSPEQAEGKSVDYRSDIFSLGVILYELATGERPFSGDSTISVLSSVLRDTPKPITAINPSLPRDLARIIRHCLAKEPDRRYQSAKDLRNDLDELDQSLSSGELDAPAAPARRGPRRRAIVIAGSIAAIAVAAAVSTRWIQNRGGPPPAIPHADYMRLTQAEGLERFPSVSPDGKWVVYATTNDVFLQSVTGQTPINLTKDSDIAWGHPVFSPDGETIAVQQGPQGGIFLMGRTGESPRRLTTSGADAAWFPDGSRLVYATSAGAMGPENRIAFSELWTVATSGGEPRRLFVGDAVQPRVSPRGKRIAFWALPSDPKSRQLTVPGEPANRDVWTVDVNDEHPVRVTTHEANDWNPIWSPDGRWLYFLSNRSGSMNLWRIAIDEESGAISGEPQPLTAPAAYVADFSLSADGRTAAYTSIVATSNISRVDFDARTATTKGPVTPVTTGTNDFAYFDVTSDGGSIIAASSSRTHEDLFVVSTRDGATRALTNDFARDRAPRWSPDGKRIIFYSDRKGYALWTIDADGSGLREVIESRAQQSEYPALSRDGKKVAVSNLDRREINIFDLDGSTKAAETLPRFPDDTVVFPRPTSWSPDGRQLAIMGTGGRGGVWVYAFDTKQYRRVADGTTPVWLSDSRRVIYTKPGSHLRGCRRRHGCRSRSTRDAARAAC